ncbi:MAG: hypothetical protein EHM70_09640, partial [Chloroflexota bacterium]
MQAEVYGLDGLPLGAEQFRIEFSPGSGFAGQVYRVTPKAGIIRTGTPGEPSGPVAIKVLIPMNRWKGAFRDSLFYMSFQAPFAPRLRVEALRAGMVWQEILRIAAEIEFGVRTVIPRPLGYYWDSELCSFAEVHEWIDGRAAKYGVDDGILQRLLARTSSPPVTEIGMERAFMQRLANLCRKIGAVGLARQYEWYTFVSQANVLVRESPAAGTSKFVGVDCRLGLAVPFFLPLSPVHARIIFQGLQRGVYAHYDEVDFTCLDRYLSAHAAAFAPLEGLVRQLKDDDRNYRQGLPDLWHTRTHILRDPARRERSKQATAGDWHKLGLISPPARAAVESRPNAFYGVLALSLVPFAGPILMKLAGNESYRDHIRGLLRDGRYLRESLEVRRAVDLIAWLDRMRISPAHARALNSSMAACLVEKLALSWLPPLFH